MRIRTLSRVRRLLVVAIAVLFASLSATSAQASHVWGGYHWARATNPFTLRLDDNVTANWDAALASASTDWSASSVLDTVIRAGAANPKTCKPIAGRVEVCNAKYGNNGWLGIAQIWTSAGSHITQGVVKLNDSYFNTARYNTSAWRNLVTCQEVGHTFGLGHQDEGFDNANLGTCMDYTNDPTSNQHPNAHDYELLESIYAHLDTTTTVGTVSTSAPAANAQNEWGRAIGHNADGHADEFEKDLGNGNAVVTHVFWAR